MFNVIQLNTSKIKNMEETNSFLENFNLDVIKENTKQYSVDDLFMEAVFENGKQSILPIVEKIQKVKDKLEELITKENDSTKAHNDAKKNKDSSIPEITKFNPQAFWKDQVFKDLEDELVKTFGFRTVQIQPYIEKYNSKSNDFQSKELNAFVYKSDRYPIDGLVTDKGFYDKTHSLMMDIRLSLGLIRSLEANEIMAVLLHEFGHNIDPALVDIKYTEINILSKYLTDRKNSLNKNEEKFIKEKKKLGEFGSFLIIILLYFALVSAPLFFRKIYELIVGKEKATQKKLDKIKNMIKKDKDEFDRQNFSEAFADNFARMYGYGPQLISALKKISKNLDDNVSSRYKKEINRQDAIMYITQMLIKDEHKTDIHRIRNLIKEYKEDINDPNIPDKVKNDLKEDLAELEKLLDEYLNNFSEFQNRVNKTINDELKEIEEKENSEIEEAIKEGYEFFDDFTESKKAYEELMKRQETVDSTERNLFYKIFGRSKKCSLAKDKDGYYCYTHRCRSKSYPKIEDIPKSKVEFVRSTC